MYAPVPIPKPITAGTDSRLKSDRVFFLSILFFSPATENNDRQVILADWKRAGRQRSTVAARRRKAFGVDGFQWKIETALRSRVSLRQRFDPLHWISRYQRENRKRGVPVRRGPGTYSIFPTDIDDNTP